MASSYVNDLRLNEMATGDASGTWGETTNTNLELIAEAFSYGTEAITTNADTHTTTIADGATDPGRSMFLKYTGTLDSTCTITIGPNTVSKLWIIENGTSGSQSIIIKQGSGATVTIPSGKTKVIYSDGAGSGGAMVDAFASLNLQTSGIIESSSSIQTPLIEFTDGDDAMTIADGGQVTFAQNIIGTLGTAAQANITSLGTLTGLTVNGDVTLTGSSNNIIFDQSDDSLEFEDNAKAKFGAGDDLQIYHDGSNSRIQEGGTGSLLVRGTNLQLQDSDGYDYVTCTDGGDGGTVALKHLGSTVLSTASGGITVTSAINDLTIAAGNIQTNTSNNLSINTPNSLRINIDSNNDGTSENFIIGHNQTAVDASNNVLLLVQESGKVSIGGTNPNATLQVGEGTTSGDTTNPAIQIGRTSTYRFGMYASTEGAVIENKNGDDGIQFRVKTAGEAMRIDGGTGNVGIGTSSPDTMLHLSAGSTGVTGGSDAAITMTNKFDDPDNSWKIAPLRSGVSNTGLEIRDLTDSRTDMCFDGAGNVGIGELSPGSQLHITSDTAGVNCILTLKNTQSNRESKIQLIDESNQGGLVLGYDNGGNQATIGPAISVPLAFNTNNTERMRIHAGGDISIGTTSSNPVNIADHRLVVELNSSNSGIAVGADGLVDSRTCMTFYNDNGVVGSITTNASSTAFNTSSDYRLKENVTYTWDATTRLKQLKPARFNFIADKDTTLDGFLAHEVSSIVPEAVTGEKDGTEMQGIDQSKLVPLLVKTIQELEARIAALES